MECFPPLPFLRRAHDTAIDWVDTTATAATAAASPVANEDEFKVQNHNDGSMVSSTPKRQVTHQTVLLEVVGAMGLESKHQRNVNPCCWVQVYNHALQKLQVLHKTDAIRDDGNPIWTAKSNALCLVNVPCPDSQDLPSDSCTGDIQQDAFTASIIIDIWHSSTRLGRVGIPFSDVLGYTTTSPEKRIEFDVQAAPGHLLLKDAVLALRFRVATHHDMAFLADLSKKRKSLFSISLDGSQKGHLIPSDNHGALNSTSLTELVAGNGGLVAAVTKSVFQTKLDANGREMVRTAPYPDLDRVAETKWIHVDEIDSIAHQPSTKWVTAGCGGLGTLQVELIGCNDLPQMDADLSGTDAFMAVVFEDNFLVSDVIWNHLHPRWMPWSTRAFRFKMRHPASLLHVAVFDFDEIPMTQHNPVGRVVLRPSRFQSGLTYTLHYPLQDYPDEQPLPDGHVLDDSPMKPKRGSVILRIRLDWDNEAMAMKLLLAPPPRLIINVDNKKSFDVLCYTTHGAGYMSKASLQSVKLLANEIMSIQTDICFAIDVLIEIWLWRGRWQVTKTMSIWFPLQSIAVFAAAVIMLERPDLKVPIQLFAIAWILISINFHGSRHPNPWLRVPSIRDRVSLMIFGRRSVFSLSQAQVSRIDPNEGVREGILQQKLDAAKAARISDLFGAMLAFALKVYRIYCKTGNTAVNMSTEHHNWSLLSGKLTSIHSFLSLLCQYIRRGRSFVTGNSAYTATFTTNCILLATVWLLFPVPLLLHWLLRILTWALLGPWMKLIDLQFFQSWFATKDVLLDRIQNGTVDDYAQVPGFDCVFDDQLFRKLIHAGRVKVEDLHKLRDMRELLFGSYSEVIPYADDSRYPSVPLPQSSAVRDASNAHTPTIASSRGYHVPGQLLSGTMIHSQAHDHTHEHSVHDDKHTSSESKKSR
jgi:C2 domain